MKVRRRTYPLTPHEARLVAEGKIPDPRKGPRESRGAHTPKMRGTQGPKEARPPLFNKHGERI